MRQWLTLIFLVLTPLLFAGRYTGSKTQVKAYESLDKVCQQLAQQHQLNFLDLSVGDLGGNPKAQYGISFTCRKSLTIDQARPIAIDTMQRIIHRYLNDKAFYTEYLEAKQFNPAKQFDENQVAFMIVFWDVFMEKRPQHPYIAQIRYADGQIYYSYADPLSGGLQAPFTDSDLPLR